MSLSLYLAVLVATLIHVNAKSSWSSTAVEYSDVIREAYLIGKWKAWSNTTWRSWGEKANLNVDSLWSGGPFESAPMSYRSFDCDIDNLYGPYNPSTSQ